MTSLTYIVAILLTISMVNGHFVPEKELKFSCPSEGRHADPKDNSCAGYYLCLAMHDDSYRSTRYTCPQGAFFDPEAHKCSTDYCCPTSSTCTALISSEERFVCDKPGLFENKHDPNCTEYYECKRMSHGIIDFSVNTCPPEKRFDPQLKRCTKQYECEREFVCTAAGRFADPSDASNKRYALCGRNQFGKYVKTMYSCPEFAYFDVVDKICFEPDVSISSDDDHDPDMPNEHWEHLDRYICAARGLFEKKGYGCKLYYDCDVTTDGKFYRNVLECPRHHVYNAELRMCDRKAVCKD